jgi:hypothetical protein
MASSAVDRSSFGSPIDRGVSLVLSSGIAIILEVRQPNA